MSYKVAPHEETQKMFEKRDMLEVFHNAFPDPLPVLSLLAREEYLQWKSHHHREINESCEGNDSDKELTSTFFDVHIPMLIRKHELKRRAVLKNEQGDNQAIKFMTKNEDDNNSSKELHLNKSTRNQIEIREEESPIIRRTTKLDKDMVSYEMKRIIYCHYQSFEAKTTESLGNAIFGESINHAIYFFISNKVISLFTMPSFFIFGILEILVMEQQLPAPVGVVCAIIVILYSICVMTITNRIVLRKLLHEYTFWMTIFSCLAGNSCWAYLLHNERSLVVALLTPCFLLLIFNDSLPKSLYKGTMLFCVSALVYNLYSIKSITDSLGSMHNVNVTMPFTKRTFSLAQLSLTFQFQYSVYLMLILYNILTQPDALAIIKAPLLSCKMPASEASKLTIVADQNYVLSRLTKLESMLVDHITGADSKAPWEVINSTREILESRRLPIRSGLTFSGGSYKMEFVIENVTPREFFDYAKSNEDWTWSNIIESSECSLVRCGYSVLEFPDPITNRVIAIEESLRLLEGGSIFVQVSKSTELSRSFVPTSLKEKFVLGHVEIGGKFVEQLDKNLCKVSHVFCCQTKGWVPTKTQNNVFSKLLLSSRQGMMQKFSLSGTFNPLGLETIDDVLEAKMSKKEKTIFSEKLKQVLEQARKDNSDDLIWALMQWDYRVFKEKKMSMFQSKNPFHKSQIDQMKFMQHLKKKVIDLELSFQTLPEIEKENDVTPETNEVDGNAVVGIVKRRSKHSIKKTVLRKRTSIQEALIKSRTKRVVFSDHQPFEIVTSHTLGRKLFGMETSAKLHVALSNYYVSLVIKFVSYSLLLLGIISIHEVVNPYWGIVFSAWALSYNFLIMTYINRLIAIMIYQRFLFWYAFFAAFIAFTCWAIILSDVRAITVLSLFPTCCSTLSMDALPKQMRKDSIHFTAAMIIWLISGLVSIVNNSSDRFEMEMLIPWNRHKWKISLAWIATSCLYIFLSNCLKLFIGQMFFSEYFTLIQSTLQSRKLLENKANKMIYASKLHNIFKDLSNGAQILVSHISGDGINHEPWEVELATDQYIISRKRVEEKNGKTKKIAYKIDFCLEDIPVASFLKFFEDDPKKVWEWREESKKKTPNKIKLHRFGYRGIDVPFPFSSRVVSIDQTLELLPEHGVFVNTAVTNDKAWDIVPEKFRKDKVVVHLDMAGGVIEKVDDKTVHISYTFCGDVGGWVPKSVSQLVCFQDLQQYRMDLMEHFSKKTTFTPLMLVDQNDKSSIRGISFKVNSRSSSSFPKSFKRHNLSHSSQRFDPSSK